MPTNDINKVKDDKSGFKIDPGPDRKINLPNFNYLYLINRFYKKKIQPAITLIVKEQ
jgi:hypothetical protein